MKEPIFTIQLSREEIKALAVFKPEFQKVLDDYDIFYDKFITRLQDLCGTLKFLSVYVPTEHISKVETLLNIIKDYFFDTEVQKTFYAYGILGVNYSSFISAIDAIYSDLEFVLETIDSPNIKITETEVKEVCLHYYNKIRGIINE